jgi:hypothetical protein
MTIGLSLLHNLAKDFEVAEKEVRWKLWEVCEL